MRRTLASAYESTRFYSKRESQPFLCWMAKILLTVSMGGRTGLTRTSLGGWTFQRLLRACAAPTCRKKRYELDNQTWKQTSSSARPLKRPKRNADLIDDNTPAILRATPFCQTVGTVDPDTGATPFGQENNREPRTSQLKNSRLIQSPDQLALERGKSLEKMTVSLKKRRLRAGIETSFLLPLAGTISGRNEVAAFSMHGISGAPLCPTRSADPPGKNGLSSPPSKLGLGIINFSNLIVGSVLFRVGKGPAPVVSGVGCFLAGIAVSCMLLSVLFAKIDQQSPPNNERNSFCSYENSL